MTPDDLFEALDDALCLCEEFQAEGNDAMRLKLQAFGLSPEVVHAELEARIHDLRELYARESHMLYTQGFVEGVMTGVQLVRRALMAAR